MNITNDADRTRNEAPMVRSTAAAALLLVLATACGPSAPAPAIAGADAALSTGLACAGTDAHTTHLNTFACDVCHEANGGRFLFTKVFTFPRGTSTAGGVITRGAAGAPTSCTVACHYPMGGAPRAITWDTPGPLACTSCHDTGVLPATHPAVAANASRTECTGCHVTTGHLDGAVQVAGHDPAWMDTASPAFHASSANQGLAACERCHGARLAGLGAAPSCASCHDRALPAGVTSWATSCVMCHGGTDDASGAPPRATWGNAGDPVRVGAHTAHARGGALAPAYDCGVCHVKPADAFAAGHIDAATVATVTFSGIAVRGQVPTWDRATGTCANVYCHGATVAGGSHKAPAWTAGSGEAACGTCHGAPPPSPHPAASGLASCASCHSETVGADGAVIPPAQGGKHLDGTIQATGGHPASWMDRTSGGFHAYAADRNLASCQGCHGAALDGVGGSATTSCATCHGAGWTTGCTMCHGGTNDQTGAPPRTTWGNAGDAVRVGAHARHLAGSANAPAVACGACHVVPADALAAGHADGATATVTFAGLAVAGNARPTWDRAAATCATTYCHGGYSGTFTYGVWDWGLDARVDQTFAYSGGGTTPAWTGGPMTCGSCHGAPPAGSAWHDPGHGAGMTECSLCHPGVDAAGTSFVDPSRHVDGVVDVTPAWSSSCFNCH